jgi:hypothetical protein
MDATRFDRLTCRLAQLGSRRAALGSVLAGSLTALGLAEADAKKKHKKKRKKDRSAPPPSPPAPLACPVPCVGGTCSSGACVCPLNTELCNGNCVALCTPGAIRNPTSCSCCVVNNTLCPALYPCCSGDCDVICVGQMNGTPCSFNAQCASEACKGGVCG